MKKTVFTYALIAGGLGVALPAGAQLPPPRDDLLLDLSDGSLATLILDGIPTPVSFQGGTLSLTLDGDSFCAALPSTGCTARVNGIRVSTNDVEGLELDVDGDTDFIDVRVPTGTLLGSPQFAHDGAAYSVPGGANSPTSSFGQLFGEVGGHDFNGDAVVQPDTLGAPVVINYTLVPDELFSIDGTLPVEITVGSSVISGSITFMASGVAPFINTPPLAFAGADATVQCGGAAILDATETIDLEGQGDIVGYRWFDQDGVLLSTAPTVEVDPPFGLPSAFFLEVEDTHGGIGRDSVVITVEHDSALPTFTFVPPDVFASTCGPVNIGQATATSPCGDVTVTKDAPTSFFAGVTTVTWTATRDTGQQATATQRVFVDLGNSAACCPPGSHVIQGTSNNNTLNGTAARDCILGLGGQDTINGNGGDDIISGGDGDDIVSGGTGNDVVSGGTGQDRVLGNDGDDYLSGNDGDDRLEGGNGNDVLRGGAHQDRLFGGAGADRCLGGTGDDQLFGEDGDDTLDGEENNDVCQGGVGNDTLLSCTCSGNC